VYTMIGKVADEYGTPVALTTIVVFQWNQNADGKPRLDEVAKMTTDRKGEFTGSLKTGVYELFVSRPGFLPVATRMVVQEHNNAPVLIKLQFDDVTKGRIHSFCERVPTVPPPPLPLP